MPSLTWRSLSRSALAIALACFHLFIFATALCVSCAAFDSYVKPTDADKKAFPCGVITDTECAPVNHAESCCTEGTRCSYLGTEPICEADVAPTPYLGAHKKYSARVTP